MKRTKISFVGEKPIFTGSPQIVPGGFNLDREKQRFSVGDIIPAGTLAIFDEVTRKVQIVKTAKVKAIGTMDKKVITLYSNGYCSPCFSVGDKLLQAKSVSVTFENAPSIVSIEKPGVSNAPYVITLSAEISGLAVDDVLVEVVENSTNAAVIGEPNSLTIEEVTVKEFETAIDVTEDTMQYAVMERRVLPIPDSMKDSTKRYLKANSHIRLSQTY
ncbi:MAG: hypothetical protein ACLSA3_00830 [Bacteroides uniformis]|uniref:hypothetical protein n=1 Tax=Bacteroides sp. TaxID=29523 RepID=UPI003995D1E5